MKLAVYVRGREVARLEALGDFKSVLTYAPDARAEDFVSLTMPVRTESYVWDDQLHPIFQMNLPEGYLLQVLQEEFGPAVGASPLSLLTVIGRHMVGRVQVAPPHANLDEPAAPVEVSALLRGDNSEEAFAALVRRHAKSGVSGVVPKFLDAEERRGVGAHKKATVLTRKHIIKGSFSAVPFVSLNEHLCMRVAARVQPTARTRVSDDGRALVVDRFDVDAAGRLDKGLEDFCALLGMRPANKYETTWERIARAVHDHVPGTLRLQVFRELAGALLLTYALRNSDCHAKNVALLYTSREDVHLAPLYDMVTTAAYPGFANAPPGIAFMGRKTWQPGKSLQTFIAQTFNVPVREQSIMVERISDAVAEVVPEVKRAIKSVPGFKDVGKRMLVAWNEGVAGLRSKRVYALSARDHGETFSPPPKHREPRRVIGRSELLGRPTKRRE